MEFEDLKKTIKDELKLQKVDFSSDTASNLNIGSIDLSSTQKLLFWMETISFQLINVDFRLLQRKALEKFRGLFI